MTVSVETNSGKFLYDQVSSHITKLIENGTLNSGDRAPSLRGLSRQLKVSITTVSQAYSELVDQGVLQAKPQSGYYINGAVNTAQLPRKTSTCCQPRKVRFSNLFEEVFAQANDPRIAPLGAAVPSMELMPVKALMTATKRVINQFPEACLNYSFSPGKRRLREVIARRYSRQGLNIDPDEIIITTGATEAISLSLQAVAQRGDIIAVESPAYFSLLRLIERMGMLAVELDTDPETGICLDALENAIDTMKIKAVIVVPNFSNPIGALMPDDAKKAMVNLLESNNIPLIEDDVYGSLHFDEERPRVAKFYEQKGKVLTCSSFSKTLAPGYRVGWVISSEHYRNDILEWKQSTSSATTSLTQLALAEFLSSGEYDRHLIKLRNAYRTQVDKMRFMIAQNFPKGTRISNPRGGFVLWVELPRGTDCIDVFNRALEKGVSLTPGILFSATRRYRNFIRISCGHPWNAEIEQAIIDLASVVTDD